MQWDASPGGGFTSAGVRPWLPLGDSAACNVAAQEGDPDSTLSFCRRLVALRRAEFGGRLAAYEPLPSAAGSWAYSVGNLTVAANFSDQPLPVREPFDEVLLASFGEKPPADQVVLEPWQGIVARRRLS